MGTRLVTIATFDQAAQARLAKNVLDEAGIKSSVSDETLVAMDWLLSNAVGGIKVQVWEEDADRAVELLEQNLGGDPAEGVSPEELAAEAEAAVPEDVVEDVEPATAPGEPPLAHPSTHTRDDYARRGAFTAMLGLLLPPVAAYAVYLLLNATFGEGALSPRGRLHTLLAWVMAFAGLTMWTLFCGGLAFL